MYTQGSIMFGKSDRAIIIIGEEERDYIASVQIEQTGGGAIAETMESKRLANANRLVKCWNEHDKLFKALTKEHTLRTDTELQRDDLLEACKDGIKFLDSTTSGIGLVSEKQNKAAFRRILEQVIAKAQP